MLGGIFYAYFCMVYLVVMMSKFKNNVVSEVKTRRKAAKNRNVCDIHEDLHEDFEPIFNALLTSAVVILC